MALAPRFRRAALAGLLLATLVHVACASSGGGGKPGGMPPAERLAEARERIDVWLQGHPDLSPSALLVIDPLRRWYGLEGWDNLDSRYRHALRRSRRPGLPQDRQGPYLRILSRVIRPMNIDARGRTWEVLSPSLIEVDSLNTLTIPGLYCDQVPYPEDYVGILRRGGERGDYYLTHVGLGLMWARENGCEEPVPPPFFDDVAAAIGALPGTRPGVHDLEIEATAFAMYMGRRDLVKPDFVSAMLDAQQPDGGYALDSAIADSESSWHPTVLALWVILGVENPDVPMTPMVKAPAGRR